MSSSKLSFKINIILLIILIISLSLSGYISYINFQNTLLKQSRTEAESLAIFAADEVVSPVYFLNIEKMDDLIRNIKRNPNIKSVYILHPDGRGITDGGRENNEIFNKQFNDDFIQQSIPNNDIIIQSNKSELKIAAPIKLDEKIGILVLYYSLDEVNKNLLIFTVEFILIILSALIIAFIIGTFLIKKLTDPILKLKHSSDLISKGDYDTSITIKSNDEIGDLALSFENMRKEIKDYITRINKLLNQKDSFINQLGHDLKNPLGPVVNLVPLLLKNEKDHDKKEMLEIINRNSKYMKNLVANTLELARLNSSNIQFIYEKLNLVDTFNNIIENNKWLIDEYDIKIKSNINENIMISADKMRIEELLNNLLTNSIKYSRTNGEIIIDAYEEKKHVTVTIKDNGIGMTKEQIGQIFDEFYKADGSRHDFESSGLGMSICKKIVELHGGNIWAESKGLRKGSTFYFTLPISKTKDNDNKNRDISNEVDMIINKNI